MVSKGPKSGTFEFAQKIFVHTHGLCMTHAAFRKNWRGSSATEKKMSNDNVLY